MEDRLIKLVEQREEELALARDVDVCAALLIPAVADGVELGHLLLAERLDDDVAVLVVEGQDLVDLVGLERRRVVLDDACGGSGSVRSSARKLREEAPGPA